MWILNQNLRLFFTLCVFISVLPLSALAEVISNVTIQRNQAGYLPNSDKKIILTGLPMPAGKQPGALLLDPEKRDWRRALAKKGAPVFAPEIKALGGGAWQIDLSGYTSVGQYVLRIENTPTRANLLTDSLVKSGLIAPSPDSVVNSVPSLTLDIPLDITESALWAPMTWALRSIYMSRSGQPVIDEKTGTIRGAIQMQDALLPDQSALFDAVGGWVDGGADDRKTVKNNAWVTAMLLRLSAQNPRAIESLSLNYPPGTLRDESGRLSNILVEATYGLEWLMAMQASNGSVYAGVISLPSNGQDNFSARVLQPPSALSTAIATAVLAEGARQLKPKNEALAVRCLLAAQRGWQWLSRQNEAPLSETTWAAMMLALVTQEPLYTKWIETHLSLATPSDLSSPAWLGWTAWAQSGTNSTRNQAKTAFLEALRGQYLAQRSAANISDRANLSVWVAEAWRLTNQSAYRDALVATANETLGENVLGQAFLTMPTPDDRLRWPQWPAAVRTPCHALVRRPGDLIAGLLVSGPMLGTGRMKNPLPSYRDAAIRCVDNAASIAPTASFSYALGVLNTAMSASGQSSP
ncbi:MAG: glycoside hydrolase family 9 protein [Vampirovibrionales bacterium]|nr:glycoside hydrolase family 9 protein [Vampirovibrionales bacterium]